MNNKRTNFVTLLAKLIKELTPLIKELRIIKELY
jgi:hypothetical protein